MNYRLYDLKTRAPLDTLELHVLARAYFAAWRAVHGTLPEGPHPLPMLRSVVEYGSSSDRLAVVTDTIQNLTRSR